MNGDDRRNRDGDHTFVIPQIARVGKAQERPPDSTRRVVKSRVEQYDEQSCGHRDERNDCRSEQQALMQATEQQAFEGKANIHQRLRANAVSVFTVMPLIDAWL